jgi:hypothetical protein
LTHMFPLTLFSVPRYPESVIVSLVDKFCTVLDVMRIPIKNPLLNLTIDAQ